jgi:hypothetical protein
MKPAPAVLRLIIDGAARAGIHLDPRKPALRRLAEELAVETAHHEAAHLAAAFFAGGYDTKAPSLSIVPDDAIRGRCKDHTDHAEHYLAAFPPALRYCAGLRVLLGLLAGRAAEYRVTPACRRKAVLDPQDEGWTRRGSDLYRAKRTARLVVGRKQSPDALLETAGRYADEMLDLPKVSAVVKRLATLLLKKGIVRGKEACALCAPIADLSMNLPAWRDRLYKEAA